MSQTLHPCWVGHPTAQIPCRGRGQVPQPEAVTDLVFEMYQVGFEAAGCGAVYGGW